MRIGELAHITEVSCDAIRLYERKGLLTSDRHTNGYRDFDPTAVQVINIIKTAQALGFKLAEIKAVLPTVAATVPPEHIEAHLTAKITEIELKISDLQHLKSLIEIQRNNLCPLEK